MPVTPIGIAWFHEADYNGLREIFEDGPKLAPTYEQWLESANSLVEFLEGQGVVIEKVYLTPEDFPRWCGEHGRRLNNRSRGEFIASVIEARYKNNP